MVLYKPGKSAEVALQGFEVSSEGKSLRLVPGYGQVGTDIVEYRVQGRTAYNVRTVNAGLAEPPMWQQVLTKPAIPALEWVAISTRRWARRFWTADLPYPC